MVVDLFSGFDYSCMVFFNCSILVWVPVCLLFIGLLLGYLVVPNQISIIMLSLMCLLYYRAQNVVLRGFYHLIVCVFICILCMNFFGVIPLTVSATSQLYMSTCFAVPFWMSVVLSGLFYNFSFTVGHLLPYGTPGFLAGFIPYAELLSIFLRPLTLSLRLVVNIMAGHIMLGLISSVLVIMVGSSFISGVLVSFFVGVGYFVFEYGIHFLQSLIFTYLLVLYGDEHSPVRVM